MPHSISVAAVSPSAPHVNPEPGINASDLRILICCDAMVERNGVGSYYGDLIQHLAPVVDHIELIAPGHGPDSWMSIPLPGDATQRIAMPSLTRLKRRFREVNPNVAIVATPGPYGLLGARYAGQRRVPVIYGFHTDFESLSRMYWGRFFGPMTLSYLKAMNNVLFKRACLVLAHSESMVETARRLGARRVELAATLLPSQFDAPPAPLRATVERVLFVGRLAAEKRIDRLLAAAAERPQLEFSFAGQGPLSESLQAAAGGMDNVNHLGWLPRERIPACLAEHDLLVLPSDVESFGTVALEAIACKRTPLVSRHCGIGDWQELEPALFRFDPAGPDALIQALDRIREQSLEEREARARKGLEAYRAVSRRGREQWLETLTSVAGHLNPRAA